MKYLLFLALLACGTSSVKVDVCTVNGPRAICATPKYEIYRKEYSSMIGYRCTKLEFYEAYRNACDFGDPVPEIVRCEIKESPFGPKVECDNGSETILPAKNYICVSPRHYARLVARCE